MALRESTTRCLAVGIAVSVAAWIARPCYAQQKIGERARLSETSAPDAETKQNVAKTLTSALTMAVNGEVESLVDSFVPPDRDRIGEISSDNFSGYIESMKKFKTAWLAKYQQSYGTALNFAALPHAIEQMNGKQVSVRLPSDPEVRLHVRDVGALTPEWRIDVPDSLDKQALQSALDRSATELISAQLPDDMQKAYQMAAVAVFSQFDYRAGADEQSEAAPENP